AAEAPAVDDVVEDDLDRPRLQHVRRRLADDREERQHQRLPLRPQQMADPWRTVAWRAFLGESLTHGCQLMPVQARSARDALPPTLCHLIWTDAMDLLHASGESQSDRGPIRMTGRSASQCLPRALSSRPEDNVLQIPSFSHYDCSEALYSASHA